MAFWLILIGIMGGFFGGMGMGGGTLLIPMLTIFLDFAQKDAQLINLITFIIMSSFALILHFKNKLVKIKTGLVLAFVGIIFSLGSSFVVSNIDNQILKFCFGSFLVVLSSIEFTLLILNWHKK